MLYRFLWNLVEPFRRIRSKWFLAKSMKHSVTGDARRLARMGKQGRGRLQAAKQQAGGARSAAQGHAGRVKGMANAVNAGGRMANQPGFGGGHPGAPGMPNVPGSNPGTGAGGPPGMPGPPKGRIRRCGFLWLKRACIDCGNLMEKGWDSCPYCAAAAEPSAPPPVQGAPKTQAFQINASGTGSSNMALLGWLVPVRGPQRGELFTLASESSVGTDPECTVVLQDSFMSARHCEIKAEGGQWVLLDLGSTNGTFVNDKRVDRHELVDSDFVKVGQSLLKFKCL